MTFGMKMAASALSLMLAVSGAIAAGAQTGTTGAGQTMEKQDQGNDLPTQGGNGVGTAAPDTIESKVQWYSALTAGDLAGQELRNETGEEVGDVERIVSDQEGEYHAVVGVGGFLGIGKKQVVIPLSRMTMGEDGVVVLLSSEDEDQLKAMPAYDESVSGYTDVANEQRLEK